MLNGDVVRASGSDGSEGIFATPAGLVGHPNAAGAWVFWLPTIGVLYDAEYWGRRVMITRDSGNTYLYSGDGGASVSSRQIASRWRGAPYYDVNGRGISSPDLATDTRDPSQVSPQPFLDPGPPNVQDVAPPPDASAPGGSAADTWTRASNGDKDVFPSPSGMVGVINASGAWVMYVPPAGVTYDAQYWGMRISLQNRGDGSYMLMMDGRRSDHAYADTWRVGDYFDYRGVAISSPAKARTVADPSEIYFETGATIVAGAVSPPAAAPAQPPVVTQPGSTLPPSSTRPPTASPAQPPVVTQPSTPGYTSTPRPSTSPPPIVAAPWPPAPSPAPAPAPFPGTSSAGGAASWWPVAAAGAALLLLRRKRR